MAAYQSVRLRESLRSELHTIAEMERQPHAERFVMPYSIAEHDAAFDSAAVLYLTILDDEDTVLGFFILALEDDDATVEFRRVVIDAGRRGVGQAAMDLMENYCRTTLGRSAIWLDVFDDNPTGIHIYEKRGYQLDRTAPYKGRTLRYYSKSLRSEK